jgi:nitroreductase
MCFYISSDIYYKHNWIIMMNIYSVAKKYRKNPRNISDDIIFRWSPRSMTKQTVPEGILLSLIEAASYAPSAFNAQPEKFYYAKRGSKSFSKILDILSPFNKEWCIKASFIILLVSKISFEHNGKPNRSHSFDAGAAWEAFAVEGVKRNLVVHAMSGLDFDKAKKFLKLDDDYQVECAIAVGFPEKEVETETITLRKPVKELVVKLK